MKQQNKLSLKTNILREIFNLAPRRFEEKDLNHHYLARIFRIPGSELKNNIDFLIEVGLIRRYPIGKGDSRFYEWVITEKGIDFLEKKESERKQEEFNKMVAFTGAIIALTAIYSFINGLNPKISSQAHGVITAVFVMILTACLGPLVMFVFNYWKKEVFGR